MNTHQRCVSVCRVKCMLTSVAAAAVMFALTQPMWSQSPKHPLDGLTAPEQWTAYEVFQARLPSRGSELCCNRSRPG